MNTLAQSLVAANAGIIIFSFLLFDNMVSDGINKNFASKVILNGWEIITESLKHGGITKMMDMVSDSVKIEIIKISNDLKIIMAPLFKKHMNDIMTGNFSDGMMKDWVNDDIKLLGWREETGKTDFEYTQSTDQHIKNQD